MATRAQASARLIAEFLVIVVGVLLALAADRWNQARLDRTSEAGYLSRFAEEIRDDSGRAADYLEGRPAILAALDTLIAFVDGAAPPPSLAATALDVAQEIRLSPLVAWNEIQATRSLEVISDPSVREALTAYYASRERVLLLWSRTNSRAGDPFFDTLYQTGLFDPRDEFRSPGSPDLEAIRSAPGIRQLLFAVGAGHYFQRQQARQLIGAAGAALATLDVDR